MTGTMRLAGVTDALDLDPVVLMTARGPLLCTDSMRSPVGRRPASLADFQLATWPGHVVDRVEVEPSRRGLFVGRRGRSPPRAACCRGEGWRVNHPSDLRESDVA